MLAKRAASAVVSAFAAIPDETSLDYLRKYYGLGAWEGCAFTGFHFDSLPDVATGTVTADDIVAVACLSIHVPAAASVQILRRQRIEITSLLSDISILNLEDIPFVEHERYLGEATPAFKLWRLLRNHLGVGQTTASKIMARKRPGLIPIYDSVIGRVTGFPNSDGNWRAWHEALSASDSLADSLRLLRKSAGLGGISLLRILDVVLWMHGTSGVEEPERIDDASGRQSMPVETAAAACAEE